MAIRVTCPKCHARFEVSEKFAGKEGPCPKCKGKIKVPALDEQVVIHEPTVTGPRDSKGGFILKPIRRQETVLNGVQIALICAGIVGFLMIALVLRLMLAEDVSQFPIWLLAVAAVVLAPPLIYIGYHVLRDQELGTFNVPELRQRVGMTTVIYSLLWLALPLASYAFNNDYSLGSWLVAIVAMLGIGSVAGMLLLELDYFLGLIHYGMYLLVGLIGRWIAGIGFLPTNQGMPTPRRTTTWGEELLDCVNFDSISMLVSVSHVFCEAIAVACCFIAFVFWDS